MDGHEGWSAWVGAYVRASSPSERFLERIVDCNEALQTITVNSSDLQRPRACIVKHIFDDSKTDDLRALDELCDEVNSTVWERVDAFGDATVMVMGAQGSGKSSILLGPQFKGSDGVTEGVLDRVVASAFEEEKVEAIQLSVLMLMNEEVFDLLQTIHPIHRSTKPLSLRSSVSCGVYLDGLATSWAESPEHVTEILRDALAMKGFTALMRGCGSYLHSTHFVIQLSLYKNGCNTPSGRITFVELGNRVVSGVDPSSVFASGLETADYLASNCSIDTGLDALEKVICSTPDSNPTESFRHSVLTYILHSALTKTPPIFLGCFPTKSLTGVTSSNILQVLDRIQKLHHPIRPTTSPGEQGISYMLKQLDTEISHVKEECDAFTHRGEADPKSSSKLESLLSLQYSLTHRGRRDDTLRQSDSRAKMFSSAGIFISETRLDLASDDLLADAGLNEDPFLVYIFDDSVLNGLLTMPLRAGNTVVGAHLGAHNPFIPSKALQISRGSQADDPISMHVLGGKLLQVYLNERSISTEVSEPHPLSHGDTVVLMPHTSFVLVHLGELIHTRHQRASSSDSSRSSQTEDSNHLLDMFPLPRTSPIISCYRDAFKDLVRVHTVRATSQPQAAKFRFLSQWMLALAQEANMIASLLNVDVLFTVELKEFAADELDRDRPTTAIGCSHKPWIFLESFDSSIPSAYWTGAKLLNRLELMRHALDKYLAFGGTAGSDSEQLIHSYLARSGNPFVDPMDHQLVGVGYLYLDTITYLLDVHEEVPVVNFKGQPAGELVIRAQPFIESRQQFLESDDYIGFETEEPQLQSYKGELLKLSVTLSEAKGIPSNRARQLFVSFRYFVEKEPVSFGCCGATTSTPSWHQTLALTHTINDDLIHYLKHQPLELEVWGAVPFDNPVPRVPTLVGEPISALFGDFSEETGEDTSKTDPKQLANRVAELEAQLEEVLREGELNASLALSLIQAFDEGAALRLHDHPENQVAEALALARSRINLLQSKLAAQKSQKRAPSEVQTTSQPQSPQTPKSPSRRFFQSSPKNHPEGKTNEDTSVSSSVCILS